MVGGGKWSALGFEGGGEGGKEGWIGMGSVRFR